MTTNIAEGTLHLDNYEAFNTWVDRLRNYHARKSHDNVGAISSLLFRGQGDANWDLRATLERRFNRSFSLNYYHDILKRIKPAIESLHGAKWNLDEDIDSGQSFPCLPASTYEFMVYLRHHGFPSPLLDWTQSPYLALFFAYYLAHANADRVAIYAFIEIPESVKAGWVNAARIVGLGHYTTTHPRHFLQQAEYTICIARPEKRWLYDSHQKYFDNTGNSKDEFLQKVTLPVEVRQQILRDLDSMNINAYSLFGNTEGLVETLAQREMEFRLS